MKNILLAVMGLSPQVITETLFALHQNGYRVDEVHVITTGEGKERIHAELLAGGTGQFFRYLNEYGIDPESIKFDRDTIHVIANSGREISDIVDESDNEALLKKCLELAFAFTEDPETTVFFSIAGGRKTMSACLMVAAQMYGRAQDRIYHVLVAAEFERNKDFFYPPKRSKLIELKDENGKPFFKETKHAKINLIHIPFVSMRQHLSPEFLSEPKDPDTLIQSLIKEEKRKLTVDLIQRKIIYKGLELGMMPSWLALYAFFAIRKTKCKKEGGCSGCTDCFLELQFILHDESYKIAEIYRSISKRTFMDGMSNTGITSLSKENFNMYKGKIKKAILQRFGPYALKELEIVSVGSKPNTRYGIMMDRDRIKIIYPATEMKNSNVAIGDFCFL